MITTTVLMVFILMLLKTVLYLAKVDGGLMYVIDKMMVVGQ